jgi:hypothetical protein
MDNNMIQELLTNCVGYEVAKTEVPTMRGSQKHIIQQDREGVYKQRTRSSWEITNLTFCGLSFDKWEQEMIRETRASWVPTYRYSNSSWATKKEAVEELQEDLVAYNAKRIFALINSTHVWDDERVLGKQIIAQMTAFVSNIKINN